MKNYAMSYHVVRMGGEKSNAYGVLVGMPEDRTPLRRLRHKIEYNIKTDRKNRSVVMD
jgi:hypothetical protein